MSAPIAPGIVTSLSPFKVQIGSDAPGGQPCQRVAPAQIGQRGGVLILGGQRVWLGQYDKNDIDMSGLVPWTIPNRHVTIGPDADQQPPSSWSGTVRPADTPHSCIWRAAPPPSSHGSYGTATRHWRRCG